MPPWSCADTVTPVQATRTGDPLVIRQAQANIAARRAGLRTPIGATPVAAGTPGFTSMLRTPAGFTRTPAMTPQPGADGDPLQRCYHCLFGFFVAAEWPTAFVKGI